MTSTVLADILLKGVEKVKNKEKERQKAEIDKDLKLMDQFFEKISLAIVENNFEYLSINRWISLKEPSLGKYQLIIDIWHETLENDRVSLGRFYPELAFSKEKEIPSKAYFDYVEKGWSNACEANLQGELWARFWDKLEDFKLKSGFKSYKIMFEIDQESKDPFTVLCFDIN